MKNIVTFGSLNIGDKFECCGHMYSNYEYPKWIKCIKIKPFAAQEIEGISFCIDDSSEVEIKKEQQ